MAITLVTIGHVLNETIVFADGRRKGPVLGSPAAYSSVVTARLGVKTGIVTLIGSDAPGGLLEPLKDAGVDFEGVSSEDVTTTNELVYDSDGNKELRYLRQASPITTGDIPETYLKSRAFYICPLNYEVSLDTVDEVSGWGKIMATDLGGYGGVHVNQKTLSQNRMNPSELKELIGLFDIVKASDEDCRLLFSGEKISEEESASRLVDCGADIGIITMGEKGSLVFTRKEKYHVPAIRGKVIDVTGGGDSYMGGFLTEFIRSGDPWKSAVFASAVALCVIEGTGGVRALRMPTEDEARERIPKVIEPRLV